MIPVLGLLICGYVLLRAVEILTAKERAHGLVEMIAVLLIAGALAAAIYLFAAGGLVLP